MRADHSIPAIVAGALILTIGCGGGAGTATEPPAGAAAVTAESADGAPRRGPLVVFLGDSLTAGLGLPQEQAFPALLERRLLESGRPITAVNAGVSGDTTTGGLARLDWVLGQRPAVLVVGLGANDALRGQPLELIESNLRAIVERGKASGARVLLLGMRIPTNYGPGYAEEFAAIYPRVARSLGVELVPFLLDGVGGRAGLNQEDGIHPNARGTEIVAENVLPHLERLLNSGDGYRNTGTMLR
jgi:acyl-CoA thioesterase-1